jgi:hypothetical protein
MAKRGKPSEISALPTSALISAPRRKDIVLLVAELPDLDPAQLCLRWRNHLGGTAPAHLPRWLMARVLAYRLQSAADGDLDRTTLRRLRPSEGGPKGAAPFTAREPATRDGASLRPGALLVRERKGQMQHVMVLDEGFAWNGATYTSLSQVARAITGTNWNGHRFFGLRKSGDAK